jgi:hypothetical protein
MQYLDIDHLGDNEKATEPRKTYIPPKLTVYQLPSIESNSGGGGDGGGAGCCHS